MSKNLYGSSAMRAQDCVFCQCLFRHIWPYQRKSYDKYGFCRIFFKERKSVRAFAYKNSYCFL